MADVQLNNESVSNKPSCVVLLSDFANMLKAFMGANYLTIAYAFTQSGLVPGIIGLIFIASITDHCCHLIVKCKHRAIQLLIDRHKRSSSFHGNGSEHEVSDELLAMKKKMVRNMTYGDVGRIAFGEPGLLVVNLCLIFTQFGFCVGYFIFLGNTMYHLFPFANMTSETVIPPMNNSLRSSFLTPFTSNSSGGDSFSNKSDGNNTGTGDFELLTNLSSTLAQVSMPFTNMSHFIGISQAPDLKLLVICPLPFFIGFAFLRDLRHLGFVSVAADVSIFAGCIVTMIVLTVGFKVSETWHMYDWMKYPVFFGMVTSAFEGIGTIIPIESSMEGNRHNFSKFLHGAVFIMTVVLLSFGVLGYLRYGDETAQMINKNMPEGTIGIMINICLCIGVVLTFPLQIYPVIELTEIYLFGNDRICGPKTRRKYKRLSQADDNSGSDEEDTDGLKDSLLPKTSTDIAAPVALTISDEVSTWKRNLLRVLLVVAAGGVAIVLRDLYAYVSAFIGAVGSSSLAYILPCMFHAKLCWSVAPKGILVKDIIIIIFGIIASLVSLSLTVKEIVERFE